MAAISSWQFMGWPDSWRTLAAASRALSFLSWGAAFFDLDAAFSALGVPGAFFGFLAAGVAAAFALVRPELLPVPADSAVPADVAVADVSVATTWSSTWAGWFVLAFLLAMSGLPIGVGNAAAAPNASRHHDRSYLTLAKHIQAIPP